MKKYKAIRCRIKELLYKKRVSQQEFADSIGVSKTWLNDKANLRGTMTLNTAMSISKALGCSMEDLYEWEEEQ